MKVLQKTSSLALLVILGLHGLLYPVYRLFPSSVKCRLLVFCNEYLKCYHDEKMLFSFSLDSDFIFGKMHHANFGGSISKTSLKF